MTKSNYKKIISKFGAIIGLIGAGYLFAVGYIILTIIVFAVSLYLFDAFEEAIGGGE